MRTITPTDFVAAGGKDYTQLGNLAEISSTDQHNLEKALEYKATAMKELKEAGATFPIKIYMPYNTGSNNQIQLAQVTEQQLERDLGTDYIDITIEGYPNTDFLNTTRRAGNYCFMMSYWGPDYADPETYTDMLSDRSAGTATWPGATVSRPLPIPRGSQGLRRRFLEEHLDDMVNEAAKRLWT